MESIMKKVLFAVILAGGIFALSSCAKECNCTAKYNGEVVYETTVSLEEGDKCADYDKLINIPIIGVSAELKCSPILF